MSEIQRSPEKPRFKPRLATLAETSHYLQCLGVLEGPGFLENYHLLYAGSVNILLEDYQYPIVRRTSQESMSLPDSIYRIAQHPNTIYIVAEYFYPEISQGLQNSPLWKSLQALAEIIYSQTLESRMAFSAGLSELAKKAAKPVATLDLARAPRYMFLRDGVLPLASLGYVVTRLLNTPGVVEPIDYAQLVTMITALSSLPTVFSDTLATDDKLNAIRHIARYLPSLEQARRAYMSIGLDRLISQTSRPPTENSNPTDSKTERVPLIYFPQPKAHNIEVANYLCKGNVELLQKPFLHYLRGILNPSLRLWKYRNLFSDMSGEPIDSMNASSLTGWICYSDQPLCPK